MSPDQRILDIRPWVYALLDLLAASLYAYVLFFVIPSRHAWVGLATWVVVLAPVAMGASMLYRRTWSWWSAVVGCGLLLLVALLFLVLTLVSAAFLSGVYGALGRAASAFALVGAALIVEFMGILPALQLKYLMTRAGRRAFGKEPIWR